MPRQADPTFTIYGHHLGESSKAIRFSMLRLVEDITKSDVDLGEKEGSQEWFPFSQVQKIVRAAPKDSSEELDYIVVKRWILQAKGII